MPSTQTNLLCEVVDWPCPWCQRLKTWNLNTVVCCPKPEVSVFFPMSYELCTAPISYSPGPPPFSWDHLFSPTELHVNPGGDRWVSASLCLVMGSTYVLCPCGWDIL